MKKLYLNNAYSIFLTSLLLISLVTLPMDYYRLKISPIIIVAASIMSAIIIRVLANYKKQPILYVLLLSLLFLLLLAFRQSKLEIQTEWNNYFKWIYDNKLGTADVSIKYQFISLVAIFITFVIPIYILQQNIFIRAATAFVLVAISVIFGIVQYNASKLFVAGILPYTLAVLSEICYRKIYKRETSNITAAMTHLIPLYGIILVLLVLYPSKKEPMEWRLIKQVWRSITTATEEIAAHINIWFHPEDADYQVLFTGYTEDGDIEGNISNSNKEVLTIDFSDEIKGGFYLRGNVKNKYTGDGWSDDENNFLNTYGLMEYQVDALQLYYGLLRFNDIGSEDDLKRYIRVQTASIEFLKFYTKTLFLPSKSMWVKGGRESAFSQINDNLKFKQLHGEKTEYNIKFAAMNLGGRDFASFLKNVEKEVNINLDYEPKDMKNILKSAFEQKEIIDINIDELLEEYQTYVYKSYIELPSSVTKRVVSLSEEITKNYESDYDKCKAIEAYLKSLTYTMTPNWDTKESDVVDIFLFEEKKGYCSHFATAFSVMARSIGIPTRYVQGFYINDNAKINKKSYLVTQSASHAWPEAYIKNAGWISFEPTPSSQVEGYTPWSMEDGESTIIEPSVSYDSNMSPEQYQKIEEMLVSEEVEEEARNKKEGLLIGRYIILNSFVVIIFILFFYFLYKIMKLKYQYRKADANTKIQLNMMEILKLLEKLGYERYTDETLIEYFRRIDDCRYLLKEKIPFLLEAYMKMRYHNEGLDDEMADEFHRMKQYIWRNMKESLNFGSYLLAYVKTVLMINEK